MKPDSFYIDDYNLILESPVYDVKGGFKEALDTAKEHFLYGKKIEAYKILKDLRGLSPFDCKKFCEINFNIAKERRDKFDKI